MASIVPAHLGPTVSLLTVQARSARKEPRTRQRWQPPRHLFICYDLILWCSVLFLVMTQVVCIFKTTFRSETHVVFGRNPLLRSYNVPGDNDDPYTDRTLVCVLRGRIYQAIQVSKAHAADKVVENTDGSTHHGYRLLSRDQLHLPIETLAKWSEFCHADLVPALDGILANCLALGYNITTDYARVLNGLTTDVTLAIPKSLPVLLMLVGDSTPTIRFAVPSFDGRACVFRLEGGSLELDSSGMWMYAVDRSVREAKTEEWLGVQRGTWRNGWLEDAGSGQRWYSDVISTRADDTLGIQGRFFDLSTREELGCLKNGSNCPHQSFTFCWSDAVCIVNQISWLTSIAIANGARLGLFFFEIPVLTELRSINSISVVVSNFSIMLLLVKWFIAIQVTHRAQPGTDKPRFVGVGCLANSRGFEILPLVMIPRLRNALTSFFTSGMSLEGDQLALGESWFKIYPGITEVVLFYFSVLNLIAKLTRRRMSDVFFGPTLLFFCVLHWKRFDITRTGWYGYEDRVPSSVSASEARTLGLLDFVSSDIALRLCGNVTRLFALKLTVLGANILPLLLAERTCVKSSRERSLPSTRIEHVLGTQTCFTTGLGLSSARQRASLPIYELVRIGFIILDCSFVISIGDWMLFALCSSIPSRLRNVRVLVIPVTMIEASNSLRVDGDPRFIATNDPRFQNVVVWRVATRPIE